MSWSERQRGMLEAMGYQVWSPPPLQAVAPAEAPTPARARPAAEPRPAAERPQAAAPAQVAEVAPRAPQGRPVQAARALPPMPSPAQANPPAAPAAESTETASRRGLSREAIAQLDWDGLQQQVAGCQACGLCESRKNTVFGVGHRQAEWMIVGEAPGAQEDQQGEPFVGAAGKLLDSMLRAVGLTRADAEPGRQVYIANTLKCRPPGNRNPDPSELAQCEPYLQRQIELIQPRIILAMGRFAVQQLLRSNEAIGRLRGRVHQYQGVPLIVTYHPAYLLRNLPDKARSWEDLCLALRTLQDSAPADAQPPQQPQPQPQPQQDRQG